MTWVYGEPRAAKRRDEMPPDHWAGPPCEARKCKLCERGSQPVTPAVIPIDFFGEADDAG